MIKKILFALIFFSFCYSFCQKERKFVSGKIVADSLSIENIHIINKSSGVATLSNKFGEFRIPIRENDSLLVSSIQFVNREIIIRKNVLNQAIWIVKLKIDINQLDEVIVNNHNLTGNLSVDINNYTDSIYELTKDALDFSGIDFSKPVIHNIDEIDRAKPPNPENLTNPNIRIGGDILGFILKPLFKEVSKIGQRKRKEKRAKQRIEHELTKVPDNIRLEFDDQFFKNTLKIHSSDIDAFISHCIKNGLANLYIKNKKIEVIDLMINESKVFLLDLKNEKK